MAAQQGRYLSVLGFVAVFYYALGTRFSRSQQAMSLDLPVVELPLDAHAIIAAGPVIIALMALVILGSYHALREAFDHLKSLPLGAKAFEALDLSPNAIDFAAYSRRRLPVISRLGLFVYPLVLSVFELEGWWLWCLAYRRYSGDTVGQFVLTIGAFGLIVAAVRLLLYWRAKFLDGRQSA